MASNLFSKLVSASQQRSFYEDFRARNNDVDIENRAGFALDEENPHRVFEHNDLHSVSSTMENTRYIPTTSDARQRTAAPWPTQEYDVDNDVPASLLVEHHAAKEANNTKGKDARRSKPSKTAAIPGLSTRRHRRQWEAAKDQHRLHDDVLAGEPSRSRDEPRAVASTVVGTVKQKAEWRWANVNNLDRFMQDVYDYYRGNGFWCILVDRLLHLIEIGFIAVFFTFLTQCVSYGKLPSSKSMGQILVPQCTKYMSGIWNIALWITALYWVWKALQIPLDYKRLTGIRDFYLHLLSIPEHDMQTVSWQDVVGRIMELRDSNPKTADRAKPGQRKWLGSQSKERLDAHDIANRLMRRENFLIALINKDIMDLSIPVPFMKRRQYLSRLLEWTLNFSIMDFVFNEDGQVNQEILKADRRGQLSKKLKQRFIFAGIMTCIISPIMAVYLVIMHFLTYFHVRSAIGSCPSQPTDLCHRSIKRIPPPWEVAPTRRLQSGSFESSTSSTTSSKSE